MGLLSVRYMALREQWATDKKTRRKLRTGQVKDGLLTEISQLSKVLKSSCELKLGTIHKVQAEGWPTKTLRAGKVKSTGR